eukprot:Gb_40446 [translate_table: standard]
MAGRLVAKKLTDKAVVSNLRGALTGSCLQLKNLSTAAVTTQESDSREIVQTPRRGRRRSLSRRWPDMGFRGFSDIFDPFPASRTLNQMMDTVNRLFENFAPSGTEMENFRTAYDVAEDEKSYKLRFDMPGLSKEEVKVSVEDGSLVIKGEHSEEAKKENWSTRSYGSYNTRIILPDNVRLEDIKAEMKNGVLQVCVPKTEEESKQNVIDVKVE